MAAIRSDAFLIADLTQKKDVGGLLTGATIHLFTNSAALDPEVELADLTPPSYVGYAPSSAVTWSVPIRVPGGWGTLGARRDFVIDADNDSLPVTGYAVASALAGNPLAVVELFPSPVPVSQLGDVIAVSPLYSLKSEST